MSSASASFARRLDPGEQVDDDETIAAAFGVALKFLEAALVQSGKAVEEFEHAGIRDAGLNGEQALWCVALL